MTLSSLKRGCKYVIKDIDWQTPAVQRLMMLGLVKGSEVELSGTALGGDPLELRCYGNAISLRKQQADCFEVAPLNGSV